jgi:hypothetical protein
VLAALLAVGVIAGCSIGPFGNSAEEVTVKPGLDGRTFGDVMHPMSTATAAGITAESGTNPPSWGALTRTPWDQRGAFTHSQQPVSMNKLPADIRGSAHQDGGATYPGTNGSLKNADVSFTIAARRFALVFPGNQEVDAMVWIDSRPVAAEPLVAEGPPRTATTNWISITLPERRTVTVRFAGPLGFTGVDVPAAENAVIRATKPSVTLGVLSDSYYDLCMQALCMSRTAAPTLATLTGFRVWNMAEVGTGYLNPGRNAALGLKPSPFGSPGRLRAVVDAPIDALLIGGSINDALMPQRRYRATVDRLLDTVERLRPELPIVLLGIEPLGGEFEGEFWRRRGESMTAVLRSMVTRHRNVVGFIDPFSKPWLTGTGSIVKPTGDGNDDSFIGADGIHPSIAGTRFYQGKVVGALRQVPFPPSLRPTATTPPPSGS